MDEHIKNSSAVQTHFNALQGIISRMANNSSNCKSWVITLISAILVLLIDKNNLNYFYLVYFPLILFYLLDCYYLGLEKYFRSESNQFVTKLDSSKFDYTDLFSFKGPNSFTLNLKNTYSGMKSFSTTPFYFLLGLIVLSFILFSSNICQTCS